LDYIERYQVTVQALEDVTHLNFFPALSANQRRPIEAECAGVIN
jgi:hypothetical protein